MYGPVRTGKLHQDIHCNRGEDKITGRVNACLCGTRANT